MKKLLKNKLLMFFITLIALSAFNLYFSSFIVKKLLYQGFVFSNNIISLDYVKNTGAAFSILPNSSYLLVFIGIVAILFMAYYIVRNLDDMQIGELISFAVLLSGIAGNLYERIHFGYVRDFFNLSFMNFPIFNISDMFINIGVFAIIIFVLLRKKPVKLL